MQELLFEGGFVSWKPNSWKEPRKCIICGEQYTPKNARQKCCSKGCSSVYNAGYKERKNKEYWAKNKAEINQKRGRKKGHTQETEGRHSLTKEERVAMNNTRVARRRNMEEIARIASLSNGDYGRWVAFNDR